MPSGQINNRQTTKSQSYLAIDKAPGIVPVPRWRIASIIRNKHFGIRRIFRDWQVCLQSRHISVEPSSCDSKFGDNFSKANQTSPSSNSAGAEMSSFINVAI